MSLLLFTFYLFSYRYNPRYFMGFQVGKALVKIHAYPFGNGSL